MLQQIEVQQFYTNLCLSTVLSPTENSRIHGLFKVFEWFSSTFHGRFNFHGLFKKALLNSSTFQACANPGVTGNELLIIIVALAEDGTPTLSIFKHLQKIILKCCLLQSSAAYFCEYYLICKCGGKQCCCVLCLTSYQQLRSYWDGATSLSLIRQTGEAGNWTFDPWFTRHAGYPLHHSGS